MFFGLVKKAIFFCNFWSDNIFNTERIKYIIGWEKNSEKEKRKKNKE